MKSWVVHNASNQSHSKYFLCINVIPVYGQEQNKEKSEIAQSNMHISFDLPTLSWLQYLTGDALHEF